MSLFVFQQKIPFNSVVEYLRAFEPGCDTPPEQWAKQHAEDISAGDMLFVFEPLYSPWSDPSSGLGVSEGDSFNVQCILLCHKWDNGLLSYVVKPDAYERQNVQMFLAQQAHVAKQNGVGFYYTIVRPMNALSPDVMRDLGELDSFGENGWRKDDSQPIDILYAFVTAASWGVMVHPGQCPEIAQVGYMLFCDQAPPSDSAVPDLRQHAQPIAATQKRSPEAIPQDLATPQPEAPPPPRPQAPLPKMPSFFKQGKNAGQPEKKGLPRVISPGAANAAQQAPAQLELPLEAPPPLPPTGGLQPAEAGTGGSQPAPEPGTGGLQPVDAWGSDTEPVPAYTDTAEPIVNTEPVPALSEADLGQLAAPPPLPAQAASPEDQGMPPPLPPPPPWSPQMSPPPLPSSPMAPSSPDAMPPPLPVPSVPPPLPSMAMASEGMVPPPLPAPSAPTPLPMADAPADQAPPPVPVAEAELAEETAPPPLPVEAPPPLSMAAPPPPLPGKLAPPPLPDGAPTTIQASTDLPSLAELLGNIGRATEAVPEEPEEKPEPVKPAKGVRIVTPNAAKGAAANAKGAPANAAKEAAASAAKEAAASAAKEAAADAAAANEPAASAEAPPPLPAEPAEAAKPEIDFTAITASLPPKKQKSDAEAGRDAQKLKEPIQVKSGVAGLVSKLEQQASKASGRLEVQVDEIQVRLTDELNELLGKVNSAENRSSRNAQDLRAELCERMDRATTDITKRIGTAAADGCNTIRKCDGDGGVQLEEKHEYVRTALNNSFDEVKARVEAISKSFEESINALSTESVSQLDQLRDNLSEQLGGLYGHYETALQAGFDSFKSRLQQADKAVSSTVESRYSLLHGQLEELHKRSQSRLEQLRQAHINQLSKQFAVAQAEVRQLQAGSLAETIMPSLKKHREELRLVTTEFQQKLSSELEKKGEGKLAEFDPILADKRQKLLELLDSTNAIKDATEEQLRERLRNIADQLKEFVEKSIAETQTAYKNTEEQLAEIDRAVRALADPSSIEGDLDLLNERNAVLSRMDDATEKAKDEVLSTLRTSLASLEEKGKQLQEELISSMEEDAYRVRRASEQALVAIRESIKQSFIAIQTAQDERMPM